MVSRSATLRGSWAAIGSVARAAGAMGRLDQASAGHPLLPALLHRTRLEAVRRQAAADGLAIDPWHLAAVLEGLRPRMASGLRIADRGAVFEAARRALFLHGWLAAPDPDQDAAVCRAEASFTAAEDGATPLLAAAYGLHAWLDGDGDRAPVRAALVRHWVGQGVLRAPLPLTGARALGAGIAWEVDTWVPTFLDALADEAEDGLHLLLDLERRWIAARTAVAGRRRHSRAGAATDLLAAAPLVSASTLAATLGMAVNNAGALLDEFCAAGIAVEVSHRARRRLYGLAGLAPLRDEVAPPLRPEPGRGRGRPRRMPEQEALLPLPEVPPMPAQVQRAAFDYAGLETAIAAAEDTVRRTRRALNELGRGSAASRAAS